MSSYNSITPLTSSTLEEIREALGVTQFPTATEWFQVIGGIIVQGGKVTVSDGASFNVNLVAPYEKQFLGAWIQAIDSISNNAYIASAGLNSFQIVNGAGSTAYYWLSLGV